MFLEPRRTSETTYGEEGRLGRGSERGSKRTRPKESENMNLTRQEKKGGGVSAVKEKEKKIKSGEKGRLGRSQKKKRKMKKTKGKWEHES